MFPSPFGLIQQNSRQREEPQVQRPWGGKDFSILKNIDKVNVIGAW